ncbi:MAG: CoA transferase [Balneolia bacterium]|nr:CoA transferase [Balneolia bacterium]
MQILEGMRVVEMAAVLAGPSVGMFLAELGAEVVKIEHPGTQGDVTRSWQLTGEKPDGGRSSYFSSVNWGKTSLMLDVTKPKDRERLEDEIREADIMITSFKPGDAVKLRLSYEHVKAIRPEIIYGSITGFGPDDPRTAYDALLQAETGFMYLNREPDGKPMKMPVALIDILAAHHLKELVLCAVIHRLKTGEGSHVETSLFEAAVSSLANQAGSWLYAGAEPEPMGSEHPHIYPYGNSFATGDGRDIVLAVGNNAQFRNLCIALGDETIAADSRFSTNPARSANRKELDLVLENLFQKVEGTTAFIGKLHELRVPAGMVKKVSEAITLYQQRFSMHNHDGMEGIPQLTGLVNSKRVSEKLTAPSKLPDTYGR